MLKTKKGAFGFGALVQKIWNHIKYRRGYSSNDYERGFLGFDNMDWMFFQDRIHRIVDTYKWKYRAIKKRTKTLFACAQFWKIPEVIETFQDATYEAEREIISLHDNINNHTDRFDNLLNDLIERMNLKSLNVDNWHHRERPEEGSWRIKERLAEWIKKYQDAKFLDESHEDYESDIENIRGLFEEWDLRIPDQWLPEEEAEDRMWDGYDNRHDYDGAEDFDFFRFHINKTFYDSNKVCNEEFAKIEKEKKLMESWRADHGE